jgi:hypothetical protein
MLFGTYKIDQWAILNTCSNKLCKTIVGFNMNRRNNAILRVNSNKLFKPIIGSIWKSKSTRKGGIQWTSPKHNTAT